ncbi:hypothetical protein NX722_10515 [Endozoicomonas gorgoniicola]|uniref:Uncharacterized protein n=1 Tax=Endozoicomonas gorgoniicola TaxID=1234144 RepID=A0ABT3MUK4_9GAMM|nr:hypothetical protein [Endozoicomonas gorgoniicola]MCW7553062.1 hypothetical protein [Endozoicomonas gorgoniicola]
MGAIFKVFSGLFILLALFFGAVLTWLIVSLEPVPVVKGWKDSTPSIERAEHWIAQVKSDVDSNKLFRVEINDQDLRSLIFYWSSRLNQAGQEWVKIYGADTAFTDDKLVVKVSTKIQLDQPRFMNVELVFSGHEGVPSWDSVMMGSVTLAGEWISWVWTEVVYPALPENRARLWKTVTGAVKRFDILPDKAVLVYRSNKELRETLKAQAEELVLGDKEEKAAIELYLSVLAAAASQHSLSDIPMSYLLRTMVGLAVSRSEQASAVDENRRMIRAFAIQVADDSVRSLLGPGIKPRFMDRPIILRGRFDLTQHFLVSAALALTLDEQTALNIGISKEKADARAGGSGFSFSDLTANMAGIRFATALTGSEEQARLAQQFLLQNRGEQTFMPEVAWLPQGLTTEAHSDLVRHPLYPAMLDRIIKRLQSLPLLLAVGE